MRLLAHPFWEPFTTGICDLGDPPRPTITWHPIFNDILENVTGIESKKRFSTIKARKRGTDKGKFRFFIPPSHEDFVGLLYNFIGKGKKGEKQFDVLKKALVDPFARGINEINTSRQTSANDYKKLRKQFPEVRKDLNKKKGQH